MKRIDTDGSVGSLFSNGNPVTGVVATVVDAAWLNQIQEELASIALANGVALNSALTNQCLTAIKQLIQDGALWSNITVANGQAVAADLTGLLFDKTTEYGARISYHLSRHTATGGSELVAMGTLIARYAPVANTWDVTDVVQAGDEEHGVTFSMTAAGQIQYTSTTISGITYVGEMRVSDVKKIRKA